MAGGVSSRWLPSPSPSPGPGVPPALCPRGGSWSWGTDARTSPQQLPSPPGSASAAAPAALGAVRLQLRGQPAPGLLLQPGARPASCCCPAPAAPQWPWARIRHKHSSSLHQTFSVVNLQWLCSPGWTYQLQCVVSYNFLSNRSRKSMCFTTGKQVHLLGHCLPPAGNQQQRKRQHPVPALSFVHINAHALHHLPALHTHHNPHTYPTTTQLSTRITTHTSTSTTQLSTRMDHNPHTYPPTTQLSTCSLWLWVSLLILCQIFYNRFVHILWW